MVWRKVYEQFRRAILSARLMRVGMREGGKAHAARGARRAGRQRRRDERRHRVRLDWRHVGRPAPRVVVRLLDRVYHQPHLGPAIFLRRGLAAARREKLAGPHGHCFQHERRGGDCCRLKLEPRY